MQIIAIKETLQPQSFSSLGVSGYVHSFPVDQELKIVALYTPFNHEVAFLDTSVWEAVQEGHYHKVTGDVLNDLIQRNFLVEEDADEKLLSSVAVPPIKGFFNLWLIAVQTCNMGCTYCVVEADEQTRQLKKKLPNLSNVPKGRMTKEVAAAAINKYQKSLERHKKPFARVTIYGGEPLLNKPLIEYVIPKLREIRWKGQKQPLEILCFTNGLIQDPEIVALFKENQVTVGLSIDGKQKHHDGARKRLDGRGTFKRVVSSYNMYKDAGLNIGISCTIGSHNVKDLPEIARYFLEELQISSIQFQTPIETPDAKNPLYINMKSAAKSAWEAFKVLREAGVEEGLAMRRIDRFVKGQFHYRDCLAVGGELVVSPDGSVGPCHNATIGGEQFFTGNILDEGFDPEVSGNFIEWHARMPVNMPGCHGCSFIGLCGGGCPYNALLNKGSIWEKDPQQCEYMEQFVNLLLVDIWERYKKEFIPQPQAR